MKLYGPGVGLGVNFTGPGLDHLGGVWQGPEFRPTVRMEWSRAARALGRHGRAAAPASPGPELAPFHFRASAVPLPPKSSRSMKFDIEITKGGLRFLLVFFISLF